MKNADEHKLDAASSALRTELVKVLGPSMPGVSGFGPTLDTQSDGLALSVLVTGRAERKLQGALPSTIGGMPVRLAVAGAGRLD